MMNLLRRNPRGLSSSSEVSFSKKSSEDPAFVSPSRRSKFFRSGEKGIMQPSDVNLDRNSSPTGQPKEKGSPCRTSDRSSSRQKNNNSVTMEQQQPSEQPRSPQRQSQPRSPQRQQKIQQQQQQPVRNLRSRPSSGRSSSSSKRAAQEAVDSYNMSMVSSSRQEKQIHLPSDIYRNLVPSSTPSFARNSRKSKKSIAPLPTLNEATMEEDDSTAAGGSAAKMQEADDEEEDTEDSFDTWDPNLSLDAGPVSSQKQQPAETTAEGQPQQEVNKKIQPTVMQLLAMDEHAKAVDQIRNLLDKARGKGAEGREEEGIALYKRALQLGRQDVMRIKSQLAKKNSLTDQFHQHWLETGLLLAEIRANQAALHERLLDYTHAVVCIQEAVGIHNRQVTFFKSRSKDKEKAAESLKTIQALEASISRMQMASKHDSKRKQIHEQILLFQREAVMAHSAPEKIKAYKQMEEAAQHLRTLESKVFGEQNPLVADANSLLGAILLEQGNAEEAIRFMKTALIIMKKSLGMKHPRTGTKLLHLASIYAGQGQDETAIEHYNMAIAVFRSCSSTKLVGSTLNDVAVIHIRRKEYETAIRLLDESLAAYTSNSADSNTWDTAQVWRNLGECYCQRKEYAKGASALAKALQIQRDGRVLLEKVYSNPDSASGNLPPIHLVEDASIADTLRRLGKAHYGGRSYDSALAFYKEACLLHKAEVKKVVHVSKSRSNLSLPARQDELAQTIYCMAELYDQTGEYDQAARLYSESLQLRLFSDAHKETRSNMVHCAMCLYGLGGIHLKRLEFEDAVGVIQQALSYCNAHGVPEHNVIYAMIKARLEEAEQGLAPARGDEDVANESGVDSIVSADEAKEIEELELKAAKAIRDGSVDTAIWILSSVMQRRKELLRSLKQEGGDSATVKYDTACTLFTFGKVLVVRGDVVNAEKAFKDALKLFKKSGTSADSKIVKQLCDELHNVRKATKEQS